MISLKYDLAYSKELKNIFVLKAGLQNRSFIFKSLCIIIYSDFKREINMTVFNFIFFFFFLHFYKWTITNLMWNEFRTVNKYKIGSKHFSESFNVCSQIRRAVTNLRSEHNSTMKCPKKQHLYKNCDNLSVLTLWKFQTICSLRLDLYFL